MLGHPVTIPIAGNDAAAKQTVAGLAEALGYEANDYSNYCGYGCSR